MANNEIPYLLEKLYQMDKELGGKAKDGKHFRSILLINRLFKKRKGR